MDNSQDHKNEAPGQNKEFTIIVNGREKVVTDKEISFVQVVGLAFDSGSINNDITIYTVTYKRGEGNKPEGIMVNGDIVKVKNGMIFNVKPTSRS